MTFRDYIKENDEAGAAKMHKKPDNRSHIEKLKETVEALEDSIEIAKGRMQHQQELMNDCDTPEDKKFYADRVKKAKDKITEWQKEMIEVKRKISLG